MRGRERGEEGKKEEMGRMQLSYTVVSKRKQNKQKNKTKLSTRLGSRVQLGRKGQGRSYQSTQYSTRFFWGWVKLSFSMINQLYCSVYSREGK